MLKKYDLWRIFCWYRNNNKNNILSIIQCIVASIIIITALC